MFKRKRTLIFLGTVAFLCFVAGLLNVTLNYVKTDRELALRRLENEVIAGSQHVQFYFRHLRCHLVGIKRYLANSNMEAGEYLRRHLGLVTGLHPNTIAGILILDQTGNVVAGTNPSLMQVTLRESEYFDNAQHAANKVYLSDAIIVSDLLGLSERASRNFEDPMDMGWVLYTGVYSKGVFKGAVLFVLRVEPFFDRYSMGINRLTSGYGFILQEDGRILFHRDVELRGKFLSDLPDSSDLIEARHLLEEAEGKISGRGVIGEHMMVTSVICLEDQRWILGVSTTASKLAQKTLTLIYTLSGLVLLLGAIIFGLVFTLVRLGQSKEALQESEERLEFAVTGATLGLWDWNIQAEEATHNRQWAEMLGYTLEEIESKPSSWEKLVHPDDTSKMMAILNAHFEGKIPVYEAEFRMQTKSGGWKWILSTGKVFEWDDAGKPLRMTGLNSDITERKRAEEELRKHREHLEDLVKVRTNRLNEKTIKLEKANIRLEEADRLKSVFLASMSHEFRTPLNSIIGFTGIILMGMSGELNEEQRKQLTMVKSSANHLLSLINDLLDISKIEAGKVKLSPEDFQLNKVMREVVEISSPMAGEKGLEFLVHVPEGIMLFNDKRRFKQVLMNLVDNAVKFTDQGSVNIAARVLEDKSLEVCVTDTGIGIKEEDMNKLFHPFQQIDTSLTKRHDGTGLGLYLTKKLVVLLGGDISAKSEYGRGSEFSFSIPLKYVEEE